jgi:hypothetical protein
MVNFAFDEGHLDHHDRRRRLLLAGLIALMLVAGGVNRAFAQESPRARSRPTPSPDAEAPLMVTVHPFPSYGPVPLTVGFILGTSLEEDDPIVSYQWNFGDGQVSTVPPHVLFHTYKRPGSYIVTVSVATAAGRIGIGMGAVIASPPAR